ncbi:chemotaxis protein CheA [Rhodobacteraceae bacterium 2CG4]|uniref:Chemotaxis protein CheA n=1 Tax=Halovulum marinum TaxID=2662447 RepID=A0A6L5YZL9_9RHOB|nr:chemotaxis protein CheA [Halovulum marinum]MSU89459.1 chemotaxis protein CheA [Halovulum marinum]
MDDEDDFRTLFFAEARELLDGFQGQLAALESGDGDGDTVHAAFRAVHSVKGGAAAFGFDVLVGLAHEAESVMDALRGAGRAPDAALLSHLMRAGDMLTRLLDAAETGGNVPAAELEDLCNTLRAELPTDPAGAFEDAPGMAEPDMPDAADPDPEPRRVRISPGPDFFEAGHDMLLLIRAARNHGLCAVAVAGDLPPPDRFDPAECPLSWTLTFDDSAPELDRFLEIYADTAEIAGPDPAAAAAPAPAAAPAAAPSAAPAAGPGAAAVPGPPAPAASLRVETVRIDRLVNLVGEVLIAQSVMAQRMAETEVRPGSDLHRALDAMSRQLREMQAQVMAIRAQPVAVAFRRMPALVRDLSAKLDKKVRLSMDGEHTEVDATVIAELADPLTHMIRNAMDHGLEPPEARRAAGKPEQGRIRLSAKHRGDHVRITVEDDGGGIDRDRVLARALEHGILVPGDRPSPEDIDNLIFHPGFTTAETVSAVSGRGVGMDVVRRRIVSLGGRCSLASTPGLGTRVTIALPLTLAVMDGMTVRVGAQKYVLPLSSVVEAVGLDAAARPGRLPDGAPMLERRGAYLRLVSLRRALGLPGADPDAAVAVVIDAEDAGRIALAVDELIGQRQVVLKSLETNYRKVPGVSGATILGDGQVALILDLPRLLAPAARAPAEALT